MLWPVQVLAVPVKALARAKTRLAGVLSEAERADLTLAMLEDVLDAALVQDGWSTVVVSRDPRVLAVASRRGVGVLPEEGASLGAAARQAESTLAGGDTLAVLLADLPLVTSGALAQALGLAGDGAVVMAAAGSDGGTNLLVRRPPDAIAARFGRRSFARHRWAARAAGLEVREVSRPELAFDLDRPEDLARMLTAEGGGRAAAACRSLGLPERMRVRA
jgi:2-phospho-L-lactate/phosphoenolpyruvate guanylyltransferase